MATPTYATALSQINTYIVANGNNEITANVLNPILKVILDFASNNIGDLTTLTTDETNTIVEAINSLKQNFDDLVNKGVQLHTGYDNPNDTPPTTYNYADFYMQLDISDDTPIKLWQYNGIEWLDYSEVPSTNSDNVENNSDVDGLSVTDALNSLDTTLENVYNTRVKVEYPDLFTFRPFTIYEKNSRYYTDFKVSSLVSDKISKMLPYYVNFASGNNANDGKTPATAFKTISYAYGIGARLLYLSKGVHLSSWGSLNPSYTNTDDFFVIGASDGVSIITNAPATFPTFSVVSGTAYSATVTSNTLAVDLKYTDSYGFPLKLKEVFTQAECIAELGTFYKNSNVITVNLKDGRVPDDNLLIPASTVNADYSGNAGYHYIKDITFIGGGFSSGSHGSDSEEGSNSTLVALSDNCKFLYAQSSTYIANGGEGSRNRYNRLTMFDNCVAYGNSRDGFNYVGDYANPMGVVEINCQGFNNGLRGTSESVNGSSAHQGAFPLRLNCKYYNNYGPNVADQGGTITYNVGVECFNSAVPLIGSPNIDFNMQPLAGYISYMYNRGCTTYGSTQSFRISETTEAHMFNVGNHYGGIASVKTPEAPQTITFADSFTSADVPAYIFPALSSYTANTTFLPIKPTYGGGGESIDVLTAEGIYQISASSTGVKPVFAPRVFCVLRGVGSTFITQVAYGSGNSRVAVRSSINTGSTWSTWEESAPNILTGYVSGAGTVASTDTVLQAIQKLNGNIVLSDAGNVKTTGTQSISGTKTFSESTGVAINAIASASYSAILGQTATTSSAIQATTTTSSGNGVLSNIGASGSGFAFVGQNSSTNTFTVNKTGDVVANTVTLNSVLKLKAYTVGTLPAGAVGDMAYVTDALAPTYNATVVGGGAIRVPVFYNGTNWTAH